MAWSEAVFVVIQVFPARSVCFRLQVLGGILHAWSPVVAPLAGTRRQGGPVRHAPSPDTSLSADNHTRVSEDILPRRRYVIFGLRAEWVASGDQGMGAGDCLLC